jgi:hypothetical protein
VCVCVYGYVGACMDMVSVCCARVCVHVVGCKYITRLELLRCQNDTNVV